MRLSEFILSNIEPILAEWEKFARTLEPGSEMSVLALRDHAEAILRVTARDMLAAQTLEQQAEKSKGLGGGGVESDRLDHASEKHGLDRFASGFKLIEVVAEYRALRASVLRLWRQSVPSPDPNDLEDLTRFNESIDQSLAEAVRSFSGRVEESRELFLATLSHDLRAPLNAIILSSELLAMSDRLDEESRAIASQMTGFGKVMAGMIHDLLDFTRSRLGAGMPVRMEPVDLEHVCREVVTEFRAGHPERPVRFEASGDTRGEWDSSRLRQVLSNLIGNAIEHGNDDAPIDIVARGDETDVFLAVTNRGPAIPSSLLPTLFNPFVRFEAPQRTPARAGVKGVGLGLYIAREIVTAHGGTIDVSSSEAGTTFHVRLPRKCEPARVERT